MEDKDILTKAFVTLSAWIVSAAQREGGLTIHVVDDLITPVSIDNANAIYVYLPTMPEDPTATPAFLMELIATLSERAFVDSDDPALEVPAGFESFQDARQHTDQAIRLLDEYLQKTYDLAKEQQKK